ncbi:branched-chain amino acid ABC transporter permease [Stackebrandtia soli]|uniref:branched-chain amino acid ABC transporter permease n=1 Tax=Stackebrandtia soli TaxID=1892856 RepID=UPI0039ECD9F8
MTTTDPRPWLRRGILAILIGLAVAMPFLHVYIPGLFAGALSSPGVLHLLSLMFVMAGVAMTYDLLFGHTGLLTFGHSLYVAAGMYTTAIALGSGVSLPIALSYVAVVGIALPLILGAICLRVDGIAFAMATLAFAQAAAIFVLRDPFDVTGGELGVALPYQQLPAELVGVFNAKYRYWLALVVLVVIAAVIAWALRSRPGRVWVAIRENPARVAVLGLRPYSFKLLVFVLASFLATLAGAAYALVSGGAYAEITESTFTLGLLVMVVLGGTGHRYGALVGGLLYTYLGHRLGELGTAHPGLPAPLREPMFVLGALFVVIVLALPKGVTSVAGATSLRHLTAALTGRGTADTTKGSA